MRTVIRKNPVASVLIMASIMLTLCSGSIAWAMKVQRNATQQISEIRTISQAAIYGLSYALSSEQAKAGSFEVKASKKQKEAKSAWGKLGAMQRQQNELQRELEAYRKTMDMVTGDGWSGQAEIRIQRGAE